jgi:hypothetical protein
MATKTPVQIQPDPYAGIRVISEEVCEKLEELWLARRAKMSEFERAVDLRKYDKEKEHEMFSYWIDELGNSLPDDQFYDWVEMNWEMDDYIENRKRRMGNTPEEEEFENKHGYAWWEPEGWERKGEEFAKNMGYGLKERESRFNYEVMKG